MSSHTLHLAFEYHYRGWPVIPVNGKTPAVPWAAHQRRKPSLDQVEKWFASSNNYNLAVVTGSISGLVVIDADTENDAAWWEKNHPATPLVVITGRDGKHFYYRHPGYHVGNRTGILGRRIDVRADGGLVVVPPSIHPETGRAYQWACVESALLPNFDPAWLGRPSQSSVCGFRRGVTDPTIRDGLSYISCIRAKSGQGGHNATFRVACSLRDAGLNVTEALDALRSWNETNADPPWTDAELAHKVKDAYGH